MNANPVQLFVILSLSLHFSLRTEKTLGSAFIFLGRSDWMATYSLSFRWLAFVGLRLDWWI